MTGRPVALVVEDDPGVQRAMGRILDLGGYDPRLYGSAEELLGLGAGVAAAALLIVDVQLPRMNGLALVEQLRQRQALPPVIFVSASDDPQLPAQAASLGATLLQKPFSGRALLDTARRLVTLSPSAAGV